MGRPRRLLRAFWKKELNGMASLSTSASGSGHASTSFLRANSTEELSGNHVTILAVSRPPYRELDAFCGLNSWVPVKSVITLLSRKYQMRYRSPIEIHHLIIKKAKISGTQLYGPTSAIGGVSPCSSCLSCINTAVSCRPEYGRPNGGLSSMS